MPPTTSDAIKSFIKRQLFMRGILKFGLADSKIFNAFINAMLRIVPFTEKTRIRLKQELFYDVKQSPIDNNIQGYTPKLSLVTVEKPLSEFAKSIKLPIHAQPLVSVVIPIYNQIDYTLCCLRSITDHLPSTPFEIIIVDDCSSDSSRALLTNIPGLKIVHNLENLNFLKSANRGATQAIGKYLMFLNNDTQVQPGWLDSLVEVFVEQENVGLVGSKVVYPAGDLQEAGVRMKLDGSVVMIGLHDDPSRPQYNYLREVDYCSGVALMLEAGLFHELHGFDEYYAPCYYEDADLAYRIRERGKKIFYQPKSVICHHLSVSTASFNNDLKMQQINRNKEKFLCRWHERIKQNHKVRLVAFYLPQFHPIPENDEWWGEGFTEWTNVRRAKPNFEGHDQPKIPGELGYYDLRDDNIRSQQITLARQHGVDAFCYYYYWFKGKKLLETPLEMLLQNKELDFPFCICWANEDWTRTWDGESNSILIQQEYSLASYTQFITDVYPLFLDSRYLKINNRPVLLIYRANRLVNCPEALQLWKSYCRRQGTAEPFLISVNSFGEATASNHYQLGFDAIVEFPPHGYSKSFGGNLTPKSSTFVGRLFDYDLTRQSFVAQQLPIGKYFRSVMPNWDNTARRQDNPDIFIGSTPDHYQQWLSSSIEHTQNFMVGDEKLVFLNAWNEWAEGNYLEPDEKNGMGYLQSTLVAKKS